MFRTVTPLLFAVVSIGITQSAQAQTPNFYGVVEVQNQTGTYLKLQNGWHGERWGDVITIPPNQAMTFPYRYSTPNANNAPWLLIGVYDGSGHKINYHVYAAPCPRPDSDSRTRVAIKSLDRYNMWAEGRGVERGHWESVKIGNYRSEGWTRFRD